MRLLTYNIHGCVGRGSHFDPEPIIAILTEVDADIVALQEVHDDDERDTSFLAALEQLDYSEMIYGATMRNPRGRYGNLLLCKNRARVVERIDLSRGVWEPRGAIRAVVECEELAIEILATHLGLVSRERLGQLKELADRRPVEDGSPCDLRILMGDLNVWNSFGTESRFLRDHFGTIRHPKTFPARWPIFRLDRILVSPASVSYQVEVLKSPLARTASDHLPLVASIERF